MDVIALAGAAVPVILAGLGGVIALAKLFQRDKDRESDIADLKEALRLQAADIDEAQRAASQAQGVGAAIEHLAENVKTELKHIGELFALNNQHVTAQLADIKDQLKTVQRVPQSRARRAA